MTCFTVRQVNCMKLCPSMVKGFPRSFNAVSNVSRFVQYIEEQLRITFTVFYQLSRSTVWKYLLMVDFYTVIKISFSSNSP